MLDGAADIEKAGFASPEDWQAVAKCDPEMAKMLEKEVAVPDWPEYFLEMFKSEKLFYSGVPVIVEGQTMGAFCIMGPERPANFDQVEGLKEQQAMAARMSAVLERQVQNLTNTRGSRLALLLRRCVCSCCQETRREQERGGLRLRQGVPCLVSACLVVRCGFRI
jgi:hypothetical protein